MTDNLGFVEVVNSLDTKFTNASSGDMVLYTSKPTQSIHIGVGVGNESVINVDTSKIVARAPLITNSVSTFGNFRLGKAIATNNQIASPSPYASSKMFSMTFVPNADINVTSNTPIAINKTTVSVPVASLFLAGINGAFTDSMLWQGTNVTLPANGMYTISLQVRLDQAATLTTYITHGPSQLKLGYTTTTANVSSSTYSGFFNQNDIITFNVVSSATAKITVQNTYFSISLLNEV